MINISAVIVGVQAAGVECLLRWGPHLQRAALACLPVGGDIHQFEWHPSRWDALNACER